jgi:hypothetical protein
VKDKLNSVQADRVPSGGDMTEDEIDAWIEEISKESEQRKEAYLQTRDLLQKLKATSATQQDKDEITALESRLDTFQENPDCLNTCFQAITFLLKRVQNLEKDINTLKNALDTLEQNK